MEANVKRKDLHAAAHYTLSQDILEDGHVAAGYLIHAAISTCVVRCTEIWSTLFAAHTFSSGTYAYAYAYARARARARGCVRV